MKRSKSKFGVDLLKVNPPSVTKIHTIVRIGTPKIYRYGSFDQVLSRMAEVLILRLYRKTSSGGFLFLYFLKPTHKRQEKNVAEPGGVGGLEGPSRRRGGDEEARIIYYII